MKVRVIQEQFRKAIELAWLGRAARTALPILKDIRLETRDGHLEVSATNLDVFVVATCGAKVEIEGGIIADGVGLRDAAKNMSVFIDLEVTGNGLLVSDGRWSSVLSTTPLSEGPSTPVASSGPILVFESLPDALNRVAHAAAKDTKRPILNAIRVEAKDGVATIVAADSYRLATVILPVSGEGVAHIPLASIKALVKAKANTLIIGDKHLCGVGDALVYAQGVSGTYPNWRRIIRTNSRIKVTVDGTELRRAFQCFTTPKQPVVKMGVLINGIALSAGDMKVSIPAKSDGEIEIGLNYRYMADACVDGELIMSLNSPEEPVVLSKGNYTELVMPVHLAK